MPTYKYTAKKGPRDTVAGVCEAPSRAEALNQLTTLGLIPVRVEEANGALPAPAARPAGPRVRVAAGALNVFTRQFASLVRSQMPILRALGIMMEQTTHPALKQVLAAVTEDIRQGKMLSEALEPYPAVFSPLYTNLVRSGEVGGMLDTVLDRLAAKAEQDEILRSKIRSAMAYPMFVGVVGAGTVLFMLTFVMPRLLKLLERYERLPLPTQMLLAVTHALAQWWVWALLAAAALGLGMIWKLQGSAVRGWIDSWNLRLPVVGKLIRQLELARFARSFSLLLEHGVSVLKAVDVALPVVRHQIIRRELARVPEGLKQGRSLAACLNALPTMTPYVINTVSVGEESGKVGEAFAEVASFYEREAEGLLHTAAALMEPAMVLGVGAVVGWIVMAILLPIFELSSIAR
ncbi:MAG: type II secretion system F family protein [Candidatus Omnitrophica bacterium]|nr:type II secretion system F family protein [Candidatus Omnitrophota bacterium]